MSVLNVSVAKWWTEKIGMVAVLLLTAVFGSPTVFAQPVVSCREVVLGARSADAVTAASLPRMGREHFERAEFVEIPSGELENLRLIGPRYFHARWNGSMVFGKKIPSSGSLREAAWYLELNELGLGARLHGITELSGAVYIVIEHVPGINTNSPTFKPLSPVAVLEMRRQFEVLAKHGIVPVDMQFQVDGDRAVLVDPELFRFKPEASDFERYWRNFMIAIRLHFSMD